MKTLIKCGWLVSVDRTIGNLTGAELLIEDDTIKAVGKNLNATADSVVDASEMIVLPGLVNAHMHTWEYGLRSLGSRWISSDYHKNIHGSIAQYRQIDDQNVPPTHRNSIAQYYQPEDNYIATLVGALDQINGGTTLLYDWCHNLRTLEMAERSADALEESGIRGVFGHGTAKPPLKPGDPHYSTVRHPRERVEALRKGRFASDDRLVRLSVAMLGPDYSTPEVTLHDYRLARELGLMSTSHVYAIRQNRVIAESVRFLADQGLLGPDHNFVHGNYFTDEELAIVADKGATVSATALVELRGKSPRPLTARMKRFGVVPSIGIDTPPLVSCDMFEEMRAAFFDARRMLFLDNEEEGGPQFTEAPVTAVDALEWATIGGARAAMMDDIVGSLTPGKKADVIALRATDLNLSPVHDPVSTVVDYATGHNVDTVIINGVFRKKDGELLVPKQTLRQRQSELASSAHRLIEQADLYRPGIHLP